MSNQTVNYPHLIGATFQNSYNMILRYSINGCPGYIKTARFDIYDNGCAIVSEHGESSKVVYVEQARMIAKKLQTKGYKFSTEKLQHFF